MSSPASGELISGKFGIWLVRVSNLLSSPASGETMSKANMMNPSSKFPIYWVPQRVGSNPQQLYLHYSVLPMFPIYWVPQRVGSPAVFRPLQRYHRFQFIGFPSEWGVPWEAEARLARENVSNLLSSPASGELKYDEGERKWRLSFQFIEFPSEWGVKPQSWVSCWVEFPIY